MFRFFKGKPQPPPPVAPRIDLSRFSCEGLELGKPLPEGFFLMPFLQKDGVYRNEASGLEIGTEGGVLDYLCITLANFRGELLADGKSTGLAEGSSEEAVTAIFGEAYHRDVDADGELILFHEYLEGTVELQFEFPPPGQSLGVITLCRDGVLSNPEQRKSYGVTRPWPPSAS